MLNEDEDEKEEKEEGCVLPLFWESAFFRSSQVQQTGTRYLEVLLNVPARYLEVLGFQVEEPDWSYAVANWRQRPYLLISWPLLSFAYDQAPTNKNIILSFLRKAKSLFFAANSPRRNVFLMLWIFTAAHCPPGLLLKMPNKKYNIELNVRSKEPCSENWV